MVRKSSGFGTRLMFVLALACIILVSGLSYAYFSRPRGFERNLIGVIRVEGTITSTEATGRITAAINRAIQNSSVKAVVLSIDSPGGFAHLVEQVYLDALVLRERKPVVASVVTALSGGYYIAVAADYIYAHPTSMVGNVGVIGVAPDNLLPSEKNLETGPYKAQGFSKLLFPFNLSHALDSFAGAVEESRGGRLGLTPVELRRGMIYMGSEAVNAGLVDEIGSLQRAAERAAEEAGLVTYTVADIPLKAVTAGQTSTLSNETGVPWREMTVATLNSLNPPPAIYYIYLPPEAYAVEEGTVVSTIVSDTSAPPITGPGQAVVDLSHGNKVSPWILNLLSAELAMRGVYTAFPSTWDELESALKTASCLIVAAPTRAYTKDEFHAIEDFVNKGRILLMFFDPALEFVESTALLGPANSLANRYGLTFGKGYLYNEGEYYGLYRNIYVRGFANNTITRDLDTIVLFTATYLHSTDSDSAWTTSDTYASVAERQDSYVPISVITKGNGTVAAFGDITFLMEPWAYVEDNYDLVMNIVYTISEVEVPVVEEEEEPGHNITEPDLPVGTVKVYKETVDRDVHELRWTRTGENETRVERPDQVTVYRYDKDGNLLGWESDGMVAVYDSPLSDMPFPLVDGKGWAYKVGYNLTQEGNEYRGTLQGRGLVLGFEDVVAGAGEKYFCAKVKLEERDDIVGHDGNMTVVSSENLWVSSEAGLVKAESFVEYYFDGQLGFEEDRSLILLYMEKGKG
jgi:protease-4